MNEDKAIRATQHHQIDFKAVRQRFLRLNQLRFERAREALRERQRDMLDLLPLLFHLNHPMLPGFVSKDTPAGITDYSPARLELEIAKRLSRSFEYKRSTMRYYPILAIYMMGSPGSIAYSDASDFDIWICHDPELKTTQLTQLQNKAKAIEAWAATLDLEVHFFLINVERFRNHEIVPLSTESSGSAQHHLLLEEFYRTGILISGQPPLWWMVPPEYEATYDAYVQDIKDKRFIHARDHLDFGGLTRIAAEEFFGAALWHLYKGIDSPYKAMLKLLLIEAYASEYPAIDLLSLRYKRAIYGGSEDANPLDPYGMMLDKVEEYLMQQGDRERLELARRAFYIKAGERMSSASAANESRWQHQLMTQLIIKWGWNSADLQAMDHRGSWKVKRVAEERRVVFNTLSGSYRFLSDFARNNSALSLISQRDLTILGRKLYAAFERKAGKVELLNRGINADLREPAITVHEVLDGNQQGGWQVYRGSLSADDLHLHTPIRRTRNIIEMIAWCYFNGLVDRHSVVLVHARITQFNSADFKTVVERMHNLFPEGSLDSQSLEDFAGPARIVHSGLFVNTELDTFTSLSLGQTISSGRPDALSYGGLGKNLVQTVDLVIVTSWREVLTYHFRRGKGLMDFLCEYFKWTPPSHTAAPPPRLQVFGSGSQYGHVAAQRIERLVHNLCATYYGTQVQPHTRYVVSVGRGYYLLSFTGDALKYEALGSNEGLFGALARPLDYFSPVQFDPHVHSSSLLPLVYERNRSGWVQLFYYPQGDQVEIFILDERGSLFHDHAAFFDSKTLLNHYSRFFDAVLNRINFLMQEGQQLAAAEGVEFYLINRDSEGQYKLERQTPELRSTNRQYLSLQVIVDTNDKDETVFALYCGGREFTTLEYGSNLFSAVVEQIIELRREREHYPIHITDIGMSRSVLGEDGVNKVQTIHFLNYKRRIETELTRIVHQR